MKEVSQKLYQSKQMKHDVKSFVKKPSIPRIGWLTKPRFSILDVVIILAFVLLIRYLAEHLHININWS